VTVVLYLSHTSRQTHLPPLYAILPLWSAWFFNFKPSQLWSLKAKPCCFQCQSSTVLVIKKTSCSVTFTAPTDWLTLYPTYVSVRYSTSLPTSPIVRPSRNQFENGTSSNLVPPFVFFFVYWDKITHNVWFSGCVRSITLQRHCTHYTFAECEVSIVSKMVGNWVWLRLSASTEIGEYATIAIGVSRKANSPWIGLRLSKKKSCMLNKTLNNKFNLTCLDIFWLRFFL